MPKNKNEEVPGGPSEPIIEPVNEAPPVDQAAPVEPVVDGTGAPADPAAPGPEPTGELPTESVPAAPIEGELPVDQAAPVEFKPVAELSAEDRAEALGFEGVIPYEALRTSKVGVKDEQGNLFYLDPSFRSGEFILRVVPK